MYVSAILDKHTFTQPNRNGQDMTQLQFLS